MTDWYAEAACADLAPAMDIPEDLPRKSDFYREWQAEAAAVCRGCPVTRQCAETSSRKNAIGMIAGRPRYFVDHRGRRPRAS